MAKLGTMQLIAGAGADRADLPAVETAAVDLPTPTEGTVKVVVVLHGDMKTVALLS